MVRTPGSRVKPPWKAIACATGERWIEGPGSIQGDASSPGGASSEGGSASLGAPPRRELLLSQAARSIAIPEDPRTSLLTRSPPTPVP